MIIWLSLLCRKTKKKVILLQSYTIQDEIHTNILQFNNIAPAFILAFAKKFLITYY